MSATIMTLRDEAGNPVAPRTSANAVITESGISVETVLQQVSQNSDFAPTNHASADDTYGTANNTTYGHVKLSGSISNTSGIDGGYAATPSAVKNAYDRAGTAITNLNTHTSNINNPHSVTKDQVGLGNVTNDKQMPIAGGTFTGDITLKGDPTAALHPATKQYVDKAVENAGGGGGSGDYLPLTGGTLTGPLTCNDTLKVSGKATMGRIDASNEYLTGSLYVGGKTSTSDGKTGVAFGSSGNVTLQGASAPTLQFMTGSVTTAQVKLAADADGVLSMKGTLKLAADPTDALHAATKQYVDNGIKLLWSNASPTSDFAAQTVTVSTLTSANYKFAGIYADGQMYIIPIGVGCTLTRFAASIPSSGSPGGRFRLVTVNEGNIVFGPGGRCSNLGSGTVTENNADMKPLAIYGIR